MNPHINTFHSNRVSGGFFIFLAACSAYLASFALVAGNWWLAAWLIFGIIYCGFLGWIALSRVVPQARPQSGGNGGNGGRGLEGAGKPVPRKPSPTHHLAAARDLPPSQVTHCLVKD